jgi:hypothetical protein
MLVSAEKINKQKNPLNCSRMNIIETDIKQTRKSYERKNGTSNTQNKQKGNLHAKNTISDFIIFEDTFTGIRMSHP